MKDKKEKKQPLENSLKEKSGRVYREKLPGASGSE